MNTENDHCQVSILSEDVDIIPVFALFNWRTMGDHFPYLRLAHPNDVVAHLHALNVSTDEDLVRGTVIQAVDFDTSDLDKVVDQHWIEDHVGGAFAGWRKSDTRSNFVVFAGNCLHTVVVLGIVDDLGKRFVDERSSHAIRVRVRQ